jgi:threonine synthase
MEMSAIHFYSTAGQVKGVSFKEAVLQGIAADGGLYLPESLPHFSVEQIKRGRGLSFLELSIELSNSLFAGLLTPQEVAQVCEEAFNFPLPFVAFPEDIYVLELFHGPSLSFKDVGARFLGALLKKWGKEDQERTVLVATSGDTGSAVGLALRNIPGVRVMILYPKGHITESQEQQITTIGRNVKAVQVEGSFEDCQNLIREALLDQELRQGYHVTTGNSLNVVRVLIQALCYFYAYSQLPEGCKEAIFSVPCGNCGHLVSGVLAQRMGLAVDRFLAATNVNNEVPLFLQSGVYRPQAARSTIAVSMDVGNPSNFPRLLELYHHSLDHLRAALIGIDLTDQQIKETIQDMFSSYGYLLDPHSAIAYRALKEYLKLEKQTHVGLFFATAHPAKFAESLATLIPTVIHVPDRLQVALAKPKSFLTIPPSYAAFKDLLYVHA